MIFTDMMKRSIYIFLICCLFIRCSSDYDLVIKGSMVYDGSGTEPYIADVAVSDGIIEKIGKIRSGASMLIDGSGLIVAPGFIDIHTHAHGGLKNPEMSSARNYLTQGVTTVVTGNCGEGTYQVKEFFDHLDSIGIGPNVIHLVGHNRVRREVVGHEDRAPTPHELERMKELVAEGMEGGALGLSTGLFYVPGSYSETGEIIELARVVKGFNGIYASHIRDEGDFGPGLIASVKEAIEIGETAKVPVQISHIKAMGKASWGLSAEVCSIIEKARDRGVTVMADQYPYNASYTGLSSTVVPGWVKADGKMRTRLADPELLTDITEEILENIDRHGGPEAIVITSFPENRDFDGKSLAQISRMLDRPVDETTIYLLLRGSPAAIAFNMHESDIQHFMQKDYVMTCSDGHVKIPAPGKVHPRNYGAFPRKIRKYVLEDQVITMEHAIRAATLLPAKMLGLTDRGMIKEGFVADLLVFDPDSIRAEATFSDPHRYSEGVIYLLVNGEPVINDGRYNGRMPGKTLRMK